MNHTDQYRGVVAEDESLVQFSDARTGSLRYAVHPYALGSILAQGNPRLSHAGSDAAWRGAPIDWAVMPADLLNTIIDMLEEYGV